MSPDLFLEEEASLNCPLRVKFLVKKKDTVKQNNCIKDVKLLKNVQESLSGVHPPPSMTMFQMDVVEMLAKIENNKHLFWNISCIITNKMGQSLLVDEKPECINQKWPHILNCRYHGLHYNRNKVSEELEHLFLKFAERYVGAETQSSCTVFRLNSASSQKRKMLKPRCGMKSPGRRLSHLARRRITFSSSNLQASSSSAILGSRTCQILVDARKLNMARKSPKKTPKKTTSKNCFKATKNTPSSSAKKKLAMRFRQMLGEFENVPSTSSDQSTLSFKSALFVEKESVSFGASSTKKSTKRALFSSPTKRSPNKKYPLKVNILEKERKRSDSDLCNPAKLPRNLSFNTQLEKSESNLTLNRTLSNSFVSKPEELSDQHVKKLQWAVYKALRLQNVTSTHPHYKVFATVLARVTRKFLPNLRFEESTTEKMFRIAHYHSYAVVKGKTVDEIVNEYMKNKMKNQKPQGYIGVEEYNKLKNGEETYRSKENVLQDKANIVESIEKRKEHEDSKTRYICQNRIDQIKKVICFEKKET